MEVEQADKNVLEMQTSLGKVLYLEFTSCMLLQDFHLPVHSWIFIAV